MPKAKQNESPMEGKDLSHPEGQDELLEQKKPLREDNQLLFMALCREFLTDQEMREAAQEGAAQHAEAMKKLAAKKAGKGSIP